MDTTQPTSAVRYGDRRMSFEMQPCGANGHPLNHGMSYANAYTIEAARDYADRVLTSDLMGNAVHSVQIDGAVHEFRGHSWVPLTGAEAKHVYEVIRRRA